MGLLSPQQRPLRCSTEGWWLQVRKNSRSAWELQSCLLLLVSRPPPPWAVSSRRNEGLACVPPPSRKAVPTAPVPQRLAVGAAPKHRGIPPRMAVGASQAPFPGASPLPESSRRSRNTAKGYSLCDLVSAELCLHLYSPCFSRRGDSHRDVPSAGVGCRMPAADADI